MAAAVFLSNIQPRQPVFRPVMRQQEVLRGMFSDLTIAEIAKSIGASQSTVQTHMQTLRERFNCQTNWGVVLRVVNL